MRSVSSKQGSLCLRVFKHTTTWFSGSVRADALKTLSAVTGAGINLKLKCTFFQNIKFTKKTAPTILLSVASDICLSYHTRLRKIDSSNTDSETKGCGVSTTT